MIARRFLHLAGSLVFALLGPLAAAADVVWQGEVRLPLELELVSGNLTVQRVTPGAPTRLLGSAELWQWERLPATRGESWRVAQRSADANPRATLVLELPADLPLTVRSGAGHLEFSGPILAPLSASTTTGNIAFWVDPQASLALRLATSGDLTVDFSITVEYDPQREPSKTGRMSINAASETQSSPSGALEISLESRQGALRVLRPQTRSAVFASDVPKEEKP